MHLIAVLNEPFEGAATKHLHKNLGFGGVTLPSKNQELAQQLAIDIETRTYWLFREYGQFQTLVNHLIYYSTMQMKHSSGSPMKPGAVQFWPYLPRLYLLSSLSAHAQLTNNNRICVFITSQTDSCNGLK